MLNQNFEIMVKKICVTLFLMSQLIFYYAQVPQPQYSVRSSIHTLNQQERTTLSNLMLRYIDDKILTEHCDMTVYTGGDIHSDFNFLPFHRAYLQGMEDFLIEEGYPQFVPLPMWDPTTTCPTEFRVVDPDCSRANCLAATNCGNLNMNWNPLLIPVKPSYLSLPIVSGSNNDLCDWNMDPLQPSSQDCCDMGLSNIIEGNGYRYPFGNLFPAPGWHDQVHQTVNGVFRYMVSPAVLAFWLWHAYVDQVWKDWEDQCPQSYLSNYDLYMKDHPYYTIGERDIGDEPNIYTGHQYLSFDIWCRNQNDGITDHTHQNPISDGVNSTHMYVRVRNRGKFPSQGNEQLKLYWAKAATDLTWPQHWDGTLTQNNMPMGGLIGTITIPQINPMDQEILHFTWQAPNPSNYSFNNEPLHFCLLARIVSSNDPMNSELTTGRWNLSHNVIQNNNIIWKNISIIDMNPLVNDPNGGVSEAYNTANFFVGNMTDSNAVFNFNLEVEDIAGKNNILDDGEVYLTLDNNIWNAWVEGGQLGTNVNVVNVENKIIKVCGEFAKLDNVYIPQGNRA